MTSIASAMLMRTVLGRATWDVLARDYAKAAHSSRAASFDHGSDDVRASLDFLDKVIAEYNGNAAENGVAPAPEDDVVVAKPPKTGADELPPSSDERPDVSPHERFSVNLVIVNDVVKEHEDDATPPPVPKRPPPSLPRSSSTGSVTSAREYPVSPPPRRRYLSPERRRRALMMNSVGTSASTPDSPDSRLGRRPFQRSITELQAPFDQKSVIPEATTRLPAGQARVAAGPCQSDTTSAGRQPTYVDRGSPNHLDRVDSDDGLRGHAISAGEFKPYRSPPVQTHLPKEFAVLSSPMEVSRALVGCRAVDTSTSSSAENSKVVRVVSGRYSPNETIHDNARLTVTFRTLPETGSFRRKCESRNSIHVDLNVRDGLPWNGRGSASSGSGDESGHTAAAVSSLCRSRSLRSHRKAELSDGVAASRTMEDFLPPPLPPRKTKAEESASPTLKRVTFHILPTTHENPEHKSSPAEDGFFTRPSPVVVKGRAPSPTCHRATNGSAVVAKIKEPSPQCQRRLAKVNGVQGKTVPRDAAKTPGHPTKEAVVKKTFEPPSAASDVSTDCYNVYNVRTGKISSTVTKPNVLGRSAGRVPLECSNGTRGQLTKLRNISPTREAEKLIGKIISRCKSSAVLNGKDRNKPASPPPPSADGANAQPQLLKLTARQQQRHSRCTKCALAQAAK
ncbi:hypothetical protein MTO96_048531 [Rhipicephalus appendiculatus]